MPVFHSSTKAHSHELHLWQCLLHPPNPKELASYGQCSGEVGKHSEAKHVQPVAQMDIPQAGERFSRGKPKDLMCAVGMNERLLG